MAKLGFKLSEEPSKDKPFARSFAPLGVEVDMSKSSEGMISIAPKLMRVVRIVEECKVAVLSGKLSFKEARTLQGVLRFLRGSLFRTLRWQPPP